MLGLSFFSKLDWGSYINCTLKLTPTKLEPWFVLIAVDLYKSTMHLSMWYCGCVLPGTPSCYLDMLDKLLKRICRTVGPALAAYLEPLAHCRNLATLNLFYQDYFGRCSSDITELVPFLCSRGRFIHYSNRFHDFFVIIPRYYKDVYVNSFFYFSARLFACRMISFDLWSKWFLAYSL